MYRKRTISEGFAYLSLVNNADHCKPRTFNLLRHHVVIFVAEARYQNMAKLSQNKLKASKAHPLRKGSKSFV